MDPNETNRTKVSGFESNQSLQMLISLLVHVLFSIGNKIGSTDHTGLFSFRSKYDRPVRSNPSTVLNRIPLDFVHSGKCVRWKPDHESLPFTSDMVRGNCDSSIFKTSWKTSNEK
ncbi:hypothetical protein V6N11_025534 [Hibiscus sabdariffa]|uniref:Uncharacterized protein n=2 Tax=Hibiscus sabdariffa TaxID=183260 RepID=A0ABR2NJ40_9ROSI